MSRIRTCKPSIFDIIVYQALNQPFSLGANPEMMPKYTRRHNKCDICPECEKQTLESRWSGVVCINPDCNYWFCY